MRNRIKIVKNKNNRLQYYFGDGLWFGRISEDKALEGLKNGTFTLWETVNF